MGRRLAGLTRRSRFFCGREALAGLADYHLKCLLANCKDSIEGEFSIIIRSDKQQLGLGTILMDKIIRYSKTKGVKRLVGQVLLENEAMINLARKFHFSCVEDYQDKVVTVTLELDK